MAVKKNYYRLALIHHPDRVPDTEKNIAKEKFSILHKAYVILSNIDERQKYDNGSNVLFAKATRSAEWEFFLKPATNVSMNNARMTYQNSTEERHAIKLLFEAGKGSMIHILNNLPFMRIEDEARVIEIINGLIAKGSLQAQKIKKISKK